MTKKSERIVTFTADELATKRAQGTTRSDWAKAGAMPIPEGTDPDDAIDDLDWVNIELPEARRKTHASLRIDSDVIDWFRAQGKGYQTRINAVLRRYYEQQTR